MHALSTLTSLGVTLLAVIGAASAAPTPASSSTCTIAKASDVSGCLSSTNIVIQGPFTVPAETKLDLSGLKSGTTVTVKGTITWAKSTTLTKKDFLFTLGGSKITFDGTGATFHGNGQLYWDTQGANGGVNKPKFFKVLTTGGSTIKGITIKNSPIHIFSIGGSDTTLDGITVDNSDGDKLSGTKTIGHNTDAFDVSATGITIQNSNVKNQDDCLAVNQGSNIRFLSNTCSGGHGISIGSVDSDKTVDGVTVQGCTVSNSDNGVRIKTVYKATGGYVKNVSYKDITLSGIKKYGIVIEQDYENGSPTGTPTGGIPITALTLNNVHGTMASGSKYSTYILCASGACSGFSFSNINITPKNPSCTGVSTSLAGCS
ncbi:putative extracellular polygalacturonase [Zopfochytrium polystomum]|nr:putative extracellular polygalacturonase [Zopfochytrium polystomum]